MKKNLLCLFLGLLGMGSLFASGEVRGSEIQIARLQYRFEKHQAKKEISVQMTVGSELCIEGDEDSEVVGATQITKVGCYQREGDHIVRYEGGLGGKEGVKHIYNKSLWHFDEDAYNDSIEDNDGAPNDGAPLSFKQKNIHNRYGSWKFQAIAPTAPDKPQILLFTNRDGMTVTFSVTVTSAE